MSPGVRQALNYSDFRNDFAWLLLRVINNLGPCAGTSLVAYISGDCTKPGPPTVRIIRNALLKLEALGFIEFTQQQIDLTDAGRRFLQELAINPASPCAPYATPLSPSLATSPANRRLKRLCKQYLVETRAVTQQKFLIKLRASVKWLARMCRTSAEAASVQHWLRQIRVLLRNEPGVLKAKPWGLTRSVCLGGTLLLLASVAAVGFTFPLGKRVAPTVADAVYRNSTLPSTAQPSTPSPLITRIDSIRIAIHKRVAVSGSERRKPEQGALVEYYSVPTNPLLWVDDSGLTDRAESIIEEIGRADEFGLHAAEYELPRPGDFSFDANTSIDWLADAEVKISLAVLQYAQDARGSRIKPARLTRNLDPTLALPDPLEVLVTMASRADPVGYLRSFQPNHPQFEALRRELLKIRSEAETSKPSITIPDGPVLRKGVEHPHVALLRKRLELSSDEAKDSLYDDLLDEAVRTFQTAYGGVPDGLVGASTRRALNQQNQSQRSRTTERLILINMERWRWLAHDLGPFYVSVNVPEFMARVIKEGMVIHTTRVVVGKPDSQTPIFSDEMQEVVFGPYWNVPTSIKIEEIRPYLREEAPWFFGVAGWNTSVFRRHGLRIRYGGREVDPGAIDWNHVDIRNLEIFQPPGPDNVLGKVKFVFPNKHDVYMHDTTQKELFAKPVRAESHGCVRVQNPDELAAILLDYDQGWSGARVESAIQNGYDQHVALSRKIPVHITYFTLWVNDDGSMSKFYDLYGHDVRMAASLFGDSEGFAYPTIANTKGPLPQGNTPAPEEETGSNDIVGSIIRLLEN